MKSVLITNKILYIVTLISNSGWKMNGATDSVNIPIGNSSKCEDVKGKWFKKLTGKIAGIGLIACSIIMFGCWQYGYSQIGIRIVNQIGEGQVHERVSVSIGGVTQVIELNEENPEGYVDFRLQQPGVYNCQLHSLTKFRDYGFIKGQGTGSLHLQGGEIMVLNCNYQENPIQLTLNIVGKMQEYSSYSEQSYLYSNAPSYSSPENVFPRSSNSMSSDNVNSWAERTKCECECEQAWISCGKTASFVNGEGSNERVRSIYSSCDMERLLCKSRCP